MLSLKNTNDKLYLNVWLKHFILMRFLEPNKKILYNISGGFMLLYTSLIEWIFASTN